MASPLEIFLLTLIWIVTAVGILLNAFIVAMPVIWWARYNKVEMIEFLLASVGMSRVVLLILWEVVNPLVPSSSILFGVVSMFLSFWSLWVATILCVFYSVKISSCHHPFFMFLKLNISKMLLGLFLVSLASSLLFSLPFKWLVYSTSINNATNSTNTTNSTGQGGTILEVNVINQYFLILIGSSLPLFIFCVAVAILIRSLWRHTRNMAEGNVDFGNPQIQAHLSAVKSMVSFLVLFTIYFVIVIVMSLPPLLDQNVLQLVFNIICSAYPLLHSLILVMYSRKLREALYWCLHCTCRVPSTERGSA
ncbi:bitter taste receptor 10 [Xenopus tropicalis]|uniref:Taste receptor type 2 n=1 Tax=Xenopus tropicalis TaxID=8364 RepID=Q2AB71_XENTR|nr:bitter taste receptor 10 [Xenopus tropicalis]BAE80396.1 bitter taste receptor [Xenopus tropicalis]|eukprot:NP_001165473.1 bitter taste receptor 10 [Xenopus tropicalis]